MNPDENWARRGTSCPKTLLEFKRIHSWGESTNCGFPMSHKLGYQQFAKWCHDSSSFSEVYKLIIHMDIRWRCWSRFLPFDSFDVSRDSGFWDAPVLDQYLTSLNWSFAMLGATAGIHRWIIWRSRESAIVGDHRQSSSRFSLKPIHWYMMYINHSLYLY